MAEPRFFKEYFGVLIETGLSILKNENLEENSTKNLALELISNTLK